MGYHGQGHHYIEDDTCTSQACCRCQERQLVTPVKFVGDRADDWIEYFEEIARANNWSSRAKLDIVAIYLGDNSGSTKKWFRKNRQEWNDFDSFKLAFVARFRRDSSGQLVNAEIRKEQQLIFFVRLTGMGIPILILIAGWLFVNK